MYPGGIQSHDPQSPQAETIPLPKPGQQADIFMSS
jgi:hypothetical protein